MQREFESGHGYPLAVHVENARILERETATLHAQIARMKQREGELVGALAPFAKVADEYDKNCLDECRPEWGGNGGNDEMTELLQGRGGKRLLVLRDFIAARAVLASLGDTPAGEGRGK